MSTTTITKPSLSPATLKRFARLAAAGTLGDLQTLADKYPALARHWEPLLDAAHAGHADVVRFLLDRGADPDVLAANAYEHRPLHRVIEHSKSHRKTARHLQVVEALLAAGADVTARGTRWHVTPIALAAMGPEPTFLPTLLAHLNHWDVFHAAVAAQDAHVSMILRRDPRAARAMDANGFTPLHYAAASRLGSTDLETAQRLKDIAAMLLEHGADPNARAQFHHGDPVTPAALASTGNKPVLQALLLAGADATDALFPALTAGDFEVAALLLHAGADVKSRRAADHVAAFTRSGNYPQARWLVSHGTDANGRTPADGRTPLHWAASRGASADFVRTLLDKKAAPNLHDAEGQTPLALAKAKNRARLIPLLQKHGALD